MTLVLTVGHTDKFQLASAADAQELMKIILRATPVKEVKLAHRDSLLKQFGTTLTVRDEIAEVFSLALNSQEAVSAEQYKAFIETQTQQQAA